MMIDIECGRPLPVVTGPPVPDLDGPDPDRPDPDGPDPLAWPSLAALPPGGMRRLRLLDVVPGELFAIYAWFRDTHRSLAGDETIVHEYRVDARVEPSTGQIVDIVATPAVLPHVECPQAAWSATRLMGSRLPGLRAEVRSAFVGPSTCTHLNDQLRSLADVLALVRAAWT